MMTRRKHPRRHASAGRNTTQGGEGRGESGTRARGGRTHTRAARRQAYTIKQTRKREGEETPTIRRALALVRQTSGPCGGRAKHERRAETRHPRINRNASACTVRVGVSFRVHGRHSAESFRDLPLESAAALSPWALEGPAVALLVTAAAGYAAFTPGCHGESVQALDCIIGRQSFKAKKNIEGVGRQTCAGEEGSPRCKASGPRVPSLPHLFRGRCFVFGLYGSWSTPAETATSARNASVVET